MRITLYVLYLVDKLTWFLISVVYFKLLTELRHVSFVKKSKYLFKILISVFTPARWKVYFKIFEFIILKSFKLSSLVLCKIFLPNKTLLFYLSDIFALLAQQWLFFLSVRVFYLSVAVFTTYLPLFKIHPSLYLLFVCDVIYYCFVMCPSVDRFIIA